METSETGHAFVLSASQDTERERKAEHGQKWPKSRGCIGGVRETWCVCVCSMYILLLVGVIVTSVDSILDIPMVISHSVQNSKMWCSLNLIFKVIFIVLTHSSPLQLPSHHPSICPRCPVIAESGSESRWGFVRKGSQVVGGAASQPEYCFIGRENPLCPMERKTRELSCWLEPPQTKTQNTVFPFFHQLTFCNALLAQARWPLIACHCLWRSSE